MSTGTGGEIQEKDLDRGDLYDADEIFMTGTAAEVKSVTQVDDMTIGDGDMGETTRRLQGLFTDAVMGRNKDLRSWLKFI